MALQMRALTGQHSARLVGTLTRAIRGCVVSTAGPDHPIPVRVQASSRLNCIMPASQLTGRPRRGLQVGGWPRHHDCCHTPQHSSLAGPAVGASAAAQHVDVVPTRMCVLFWLQQWQPLRSADPSTEPSASADAELVRQAAACGWQGSVCVSHPLHTQQPSAWSTVAADMLQQHGIITPGPHSFLCTSSQTH